MKGNENISSNGSQLLPTRYRMAGVRALDWSIRMRQSWAYFSKKQKSKIVAQLHQNRFKSVADDHSINVHLDELQRSSYLTLLHPPHETPDCTKMAVNSVKPETHSKESRMKTRLEALCRSMVIPTT